MPEEFDVKEYIKKYCVFRHMSKWGNIKLKNNNVFVPMFKINLNDFDMPLIFDDNWPFEGGEMFKRLHKGIFDNKQFLRIFINEIDCKEYLNSSHLVTAINEDINYGKSYLNYLTYTGECGNNDSVNVMNNMVTGILGPVNIDNYLHNISLDIAVRSIESCVLFKDNFYKTRWFRQLRDAVGLVMDEFPLWMFYKLKADLLSIWTKESMYEFLLENHTTNLLFRIDFGSRDSRVILPTDFCPEATIEDDEIEFSLLSYVSEYLGSL